MSGVRDVLLGRVAVAAKLITVNQLNRALSEQGNRTADVTLGQVFLDLGFLDAKQLERVVALQQRARPRATS